VYDRTLQANLCSYHVLIDGYDFVSQHGEIFMIWFAYQDDDAYGFNQGHI